jgi:hypothetical protein
MASECDAITDTRPADAARGPYGIRDERWRFGRGMGPGAKVFWVRNADAITDSRNTDAVTED